MYLGTPTFTPLLAPTGPELGTAAYEAERLDRLFPGWWRNIDMSELDLDDSYYCILGQGCRSVGGYGVASDIVEKDGDSLGQPMNDYFQFYLYNENLDGWFVEIEKRRAS